MIPVKLFNQSTRPIFFRNPTPNNYIYILFVLLLLIGVFSFSFFFFIICVSILLSLIWISRYLVIGAGTKKTY